MNKGGYSLSRELGGRLAIQLAFPRVRRGASAYASTLQTSDERVAESLERQVLPPALGK